MNEAYIVYFSLLIVLILFAYRGKFLKDRESIIYNSNYSIITFFSVLIFSIIIGLRFNVGGDYISYHDYFNSLDISRFENSTHTEFGYFILMYIIKYLELPFYFLFITTSFIQIIGIYKWAKNYKFLLGWIIFYYFTSLYLFESMNIIRQAMAFSIILYSTIFIISSRLLPFVISIIIAALFHKSAIIFLPFYFFFKYDFIKNKYLQVALVLASTIFVNPVLESFFNYFETLTIFLNYETYSNAGNRSDLFIQNNSNGYSLGYYFNLSVNLIIILYSDKLKHFFREYYYKGYHNMFLIAALFSTISILSNSILIYRIFFYFNSFRFVVLSFLCYYLFSNRNKMFNYFVGIIIAISFVFFFISAISKGASWSSPFQFVFQ